MALRILDSSSPNKWRVYIKITDTKLPSTSTFISSMDGTMINGTMEELVTRDVFTSVFSYDGYLEIGKCAFVPKWDNTHESSGINNYGGMLTGMVSFLGSVDMIGVSSSNWSEAYKYNNKVVNIVFVCVEEQIIRQFHGVIASVTDVGEESGKQIMRWLFNKESTSVKLMSTYTQFINIIASTGWLFVDEITE